MECNNSHRYIKTSEVIMEDDYPHEKVKCFICMNILIDPIQCSNCSKNICRKCLYNLFRKKCPSCSKTEFSKVNDETLIILEKLKLKCPHRCNKIISYKEYYSHSDKCENKIIICRNIDCNYQSKRKNMFEHLKSCQHRYMSCKYCDFPIKQLEFFAHESSCNMKKNLLIMNTNINECVINTKTSRNELKIDQYYSSKFFDESSKINTVCGADCKENNSLQINYDSNFELSNAKNCKKCEDNKNKLTNRCSNCLKLVCRMCNPSIKEKLNFGKHFSEGYNFIIQLPKVYYTRPNAFFPIFKKFNFKEKINRNRCMCFVFLIFLGWLELLLFILDVLIIFLLFVISGLGISLFFFGYFVFYFYLFCFKRHKICKDPCINFSYKELLNNYLLRVCKYAEIIGFDEGQCWASNKNFNFCKNKCVLREKKVSNEFECIKSLFESNIFEKDKEVLINREEHHIADYDEEDILFLERNGGGTLITRTYSKLLIGYYSNEEIIPNSQNFQNFYDTKNKLIQLREVLKYKNL